MQLWPAIDLRGGNCVRLLQGDYARETVFGDDPVAMVRRFFAGGARRLHIVDLDGAKAGEPVQADLVALMAQAAGIPCQVGGGIRSFETAAAYLAAGLERVIVGSVAIEQPDLLVRMARGFPGRVVLGLDARDGKVAVRGWLDTSTLLAVDVARRHADLPLAAIVYTDIATDGTLAGPNIAALEEMLGVSPTPVIASGGIATLDDIRRVAAIGCTGCIVGRALYDDAFTLPDAIAAAADV
ncbi:MAG: 1-(5-phosphoribosyl)-5-[(5-phosphoribosylamino)methylideneamino]imidazole-4-carboxamide isomerase [Planctomycetia bacterium]|nr:1-(5-phosphoribosyl)-5-[(5-phosphoribosylamino)methylideneamino]imidazole-4-carboxamide isomerase [Planctomycetia bacterium]